MVEIKEILKAKVFKDIKDGRERMSEETAEFLKNNFYMWFSGEVDKIYDMFKIVNSFNTNEGFRIKMSIDFLTSDRRKYIASNVFNYLEYMNYEEVIRNYISHNESLKFLKEVDIKKEIIFIFDPTSTVNCEKVRLDLTLDKGENDGK